LTKPQAGARGQISGSGYVRLPNYC